MKHASLAFLIGLLATQLALPAAFAATVTRGADSTTSGDSPQLDGNTGKVWHQQQDDVTDISPTGNTATYRGGDTVSRVATDYCTTSQTAGSIPCRDETGKLPSGDLPPPLWVGTATVTHTTCATQTQTTTTTGSGTAVITGLATATHTALETNVGVANTSPQAQLAVSAGYGYQPALSIFGDSAAAANLQEWHAADGTLLGFIRPDGSLYIASTLSYPGATGAGAELHRNYLTLNGASYILFGNGQFLSDDGFAGLGLDAKNAFNLNATKITLNQSTTINGDATINGNGTARVLTVLPPVGTVASWLYIENQSSSTNNRNWAWGANYDFYGSLGLFRSAVAGGDPTATDHTTMLYFDRTNLDAAFYNRVVANNTVVCGTGISCIGVPSSASQTSTATASGTGTYRSLSTIPITVSLANTATNTFTGTGSDSYVAVFTGTSGLRTGAMRDNGTNVSIGIAPDTGAKLDIATGAGDNFLAAEDYSTTAGNGNYWVSRRSHSNTVGTKSTTQDGESIGNFYFYGVDSNNAWADAAEIQVIQSGAVSGGGHVPTKLVLQTHSATAANTGQLTLFPDGTTGWGGTSSTLAELLTLRTAYNANGAARAGIKWRDASNVTAAIHSRYNGTDVSLVVGSLYHSGYNSTDSVEFKSTELDVLNGKVAVGTSGSIGGQVDLLGSTSGVLSERVAASGGNTALIKPSTAPAVGQALVVTATATSTGTNTATLTWATVQTNTSTVTATNWSIAKVSGGVVTAAQDATPANIGALAADGATGSGNYASVSSGKVTSIETRPYIQSAAIVCPVGATCAGKTDSTTSTSTATGTAGSTFYATTAIPFSSTVTATSTATGVTGSGTGGYLPLWNSSTDLTNSAFGQWNNGLRCYAGDGSCDVGQTGYRVGDIKQSGTLYNGSGTCTNGHCSGDLATTITSSLSDRYFSRWDGVKLINSSMYNYNGNAYVNSGTHIIPTDGGNSDLGASGNAWRNLYVGTIYNGSGTCTDGHCSGDMSSSEDHINVTYFGNNTLDRDATAGNCTTIASTSVSATSTSTEFLIHGSITGRASGFTKYTCKMAITYDSGTNIAGGYGAATSDSGSTFTMSASTKTTLSSGSHTIYLALCNLDGADHCYSSAASNVYDAGTLLVQRRGH